MSAPASFAAASCRSTSDPAESGSRAYSLIDDGAVLVAGGLIEAVGEARDILPRAPPGALVDDHSGCLISPGFIDAHIHYSQTQVIGSYGAQLLDWLHNYTFVEEQKFADPDALRAGGRVLSRRIYPLGHHDRDGLLHGASGNPSTHSSPRREARRSA